VLALVLAAPAAADAAFPGRNGFIAYHGRASADGMLAVRGAHGKAVRRLRVPGRPSEPRFSPLGRRIAFTSKAAIWVVGVDGADPRRVTPSGLRARNPAWSPDGASLAFAGGRAGKRDIYRIDLDGTRLARVTFAKADESEPAWSSRDRIAFVRQRRRGDGDIYTIAPAGNPPRRVTRGRADDSRPVWSPGGTRIAFRRGRPGRRQLFVVKGNGHRLRKLTSVRRGVTGAAWSPNGRRIAFGVGRRGHRALAVMRTNGRGLRRVVKGRADIRSLGWQPRVAYPIVAAAGDVACDPTAASFRDGAGTPYSCHMRGTSDLLLKMDLWAVLLLGDVQYGDGQLWKYIQSFHPTWGRIKT
jgi:Tol biopolymer transport system component